jgi:DNA polymerase-1
MKEPFFVLDGYSLIYRSYFAFMNRPLYNPKGENTSAVFGFFRTLLSFLQQYEPRYFAVAMDSLIPTFRHQKYAEYKATRDKTPEELHAQVPLIEEILDALGLKRIRYDGVEADDIMATFADRCRDEGRPCYIMSGDKDLMQLVEGPVKMLLSEKGSYIEMGREEVYKKFGIYPDQVLDYLSLIGDQSDNIPGVKGIGPKTAITLLSKYKSLDGIYENLGKLPAGQKKKLEENRENAYLSRELVILKRDVPLADTVESCELTKLDREAAVPLFLAQGMNSIVKDLGGEEKIREARETAEDIKQEYSLVVDEEGFNRLLQRVREAGTFAFDCETDSLDPLAAKPVGFSISTEPGQGCYIPVKTDGAGCLPEDTVRQGLASILTDKSLKCVGQNLKYDYHVCCRWGIDITNIHFDTMIAAWLVESSGSFGMDGLAERYLNYRTIHFDEVVEKGKTFDTVALDKALAYAAEDADITLRLYHCFEEQIRERGMEKLLYEMEIPLIPVLAAMEREGIGIEYSVLQEYSRALTEKLGKIEEEIFRLCGEEFNINSTKQLQVILFEKRKLKPIKKTKTGYSTDNFVLEELAKEDKVPELVLRHRGLSKLKSTYVDTLPKLVRPETGRIHTHYIQTGTATGRLASRDPNLQNLPVKTEEGRKIRSAFVPRPGCTFISADYSQIELVVLAHLSEDPELCAAFEKEEDIHRRTAGLIFDVPPGEIQPEQRRIAKVINFGIMYGMSGFRLSRELGIPRQRADEFIEAYFIKYGKVRDFIDQTVAEAEKTGYARTMFGRIRFIPGINSKNRTEKMAAERAAVNTPIQGTAADIVKLAMLEISNKLPAHNPEAKLLLQVHDELIFEVPSGSAGEAEELIRRLMESVVQLRVPLRVGIETGTSWGDFH